MSWAGKRRFLIFLIIGTVAAAFLAVLLIATLYETPTCSDGKQNQDESGVDCGGSCAYLCREETLAPTVLFTKGLRNGEGRTDVIAQIENKNALAAARNVPYRLTLYGAGQVLVNEVKGTLDLPPASVVPLFIPGIASGKQTVTGAFLAIDSSVIDWFSLSPNARVVPSVSTPTLVGTTLLPRVDAIIANPGLRALEDVRAIVMVRSASGEIIAASSTLIPSIPAGGQTTAIFTWNEPFKAKPASIEVIPIVSL